MKHHYIRIFRDVPVDQKPPGAHPDWPVTHYPVEVGDPAPVSGLIGPLTDSEFEQLLEQERPAYEASISTPEAIAWYEAPQLPGAREARYELIDRKTDELIALGFTHAGKQFSLSLPAQVKLLGTYNARTMLSYPVVWNTINDSGTHDIADAAEVETMYAAALATIRTALDGGTALKNSVRVATTLAEIAAVVDSR
jgi:hypothetical protein